MRSAVELAKDWRSDRALRRLEAMLAVADLDSSLIITGNGDVLEPEQGIVAIGSGGAYAQSAARALIENTELSPEEVIKKSLTIAGDLCIYTNRNFTIENNVFTLRSQDDKPLVYDSVDNLKVKNNIVISPNGETTKLSY